MYIPRPSGLLTPNTARVRRVGFGRDAAAGRKPIEGPDDPPLACAVQPTTIADRPEHMRETGTTYLTVKFYTDPACIVRDEIIDDLGRTLVVIGVRGPSGGLRRSWPVDCEYKPPPRT